jgi:hypothetical protein
MFAGMAEWLKRQPGTFQLQGQKILESWFSKGILGSKFLLHEVALRTIFWNVIFRKKIAFIAVYEGR